MRKIDYGRCPKCGLPYKEAKINASIILEPDYKATADVTLLHSLYNNKHAYKTNVYYRYDHNEMLMQAVRKLAIATEVQ